jgi:hypothetical protein
MTAWVAVNALSYWFLIVPLTAQEKRQQEMKRQVLGKYVYGLSLLDVEQDILDRQRDSEVAAKI